MTEPKRLFDCLAYHLERKPLPDMLAGKVDGRYEPYSTQQVKETVDELSAGLINLGFGGSHTNDEQADKIGIISKNRPEWIMIDLAVQQIGAVLIPIYPTINLPELEFILNDARVKAIVVNDEDLFKKVHAVKSKVSSLETIFSFEQVQGATHWSAIRAAATPQTISRIPDIADSIKNSDLATIIYTSGTTGTPKGVMLSHNNILSNILSCMPYFPPGEDLRTMSFLPLNHIFEKMISYLYLFKGTSIYYAESMETIGDNLKEIRPHFFTTVPRLLEKVYDRIMERGNDLTGIKRKLFFWAHGLAERFEINKDQGAWYRLQLKLANKLVFSKWREALGDRVLCIVSGGAACQVKLIRIFTAAGIIVMEGYGLTETSPVVAVNRYDVKDRMFGTVGPLIQGVEVQIAEDGEILTKGPNVMMGYFKRPDLTSEVMSGEWFHTGDIGQIIDNKFLKITDRKKEMFKTSGGKYVAPLPIENKLKESMYIEQVMVIGPGRKFVSALLVPTFKNLIDWAASHGIQDRSIESLIKNPQVIGFYKKLIEELNQGFSHVEQVKKFELLPAEWGVDTGEMTPKLSLKRKVVMEKFQHVIEHIYHDE